MTSLPRPNHLTETLLATYDVPEEVRQGIADAGFLHATPIQAKALPIALAGRDVAGQAQTGTGKTAAFLITIFTRLMRSPRKRPGRGPRALVIAPTRELVVQIRADAQLLGRHTGITTLAVYGGIDYRRQKEALRGVPDLTVVTNSIQAANVLHRDRRPDLTVILTGGVRTPSDALVGPVAVTTLRSLHVDVLFMGVHGMTADAGFTTPNLLEAETDQAFVVSAERVVVTADHTKWGVRGLSRIVRLDEVHALVSDGGLPADARTILEEHVRELLVVAKGKRRRRRGGV